MAGTCYPYLSWATGSAVKPKTGQLKLTDYHLVSYSNLSYFMDIFSAILAAYYAILAFKVVVVSDNQNLKNTGTVVYPYFLYRVSRITGEFVFIFLAFARQGLPIVIFMVKLLNIHRYRELWRCMFFKKTSFSCL